MNKTNTKWVKKRHAINWAIINFLAKPIVKFKYHLKYKKFSDSKNRNYLVLMNHQTPFDQFFFTLMFYGKKYIVATEDIMRNGFISKVINFIVAPIPIKKCSNDIGAVMNCIKVAKEGATILLSPEGNRTYNGETCYIKESIAKLAKKLELPIAFLKFEGGYSVQPRWSDVIRKGNLTAYISKVLQPEKYLNMSNEELFEIIKKELYNDESGDTGLYKSKKRAEYIERAMYVCPHCGLTTFYSKNNVIVCEKCGLQIDYNEHKLLSGINKDFPFSTVGEWYSYQNDFINELSIKKYISKPCYKEKIKLYRVFPNYSKKTISKSAIISLFSDKLEVQSKKQTIVYSFDDIRAITILGRNKFDFYYKDEIYQIKPSKRFNALKYMNFYYHYKNIKEKNNDKFLGI